MSDRHCLLSNNFIYTGVDMSDVEEEARFSVPSSCPCTWPKPITAILNTVLRCC